MSCLRKARFLFLVAGVAIGASATAASADALLTLSITEVGNDLTTSAYGTVDLSALNFLLSHGGPGSGILYGGGFRTGPNGPVNAYSGLSGPDSFGGSSSGGLVTSSAGNLVQLEVWNGRLFLPQSYVSGTPLNGTALIPNKSYASLNLTPGTYVWTYGSGPNAGTIVLNIPTPGAAAVLGLVGLVATRRRR